jgi:dTDP-4-amino-4,6-dideoxygalactose transaminase
VHSPLTLGDVLRAGLHSVVGGTDPRLDVAELLCREYAADRVVPCASGTAALQLALELASRRLAQAPLLALPAFTCFDVATAAVGARARVTLYDIDPSTLNPDFDSLLHALKEGARVVVVSPLYGVPVDWDAVEALAAEYEAVVIEDAAQGQGASWRGRPLGSLGPISILSFGRGKGWTGIQGGALLLRQGWADGLADPRPYINPVGELRGFLSAVAQWSMGRPACYAIPASIPWLRLGETLYREPAPIKAITRFAAALVARSQAAANREADARRANADWLLRRFKPDSRFCTVQIKPAGTPGYLRLALRVRAGAAGFAGLRRSRQLGAARSYPSTLAKLAQLQDRLVGRADRFLGGETLSRELVTFPTHSRLSAAERSDLLQLLHTHAGEAS